MIWGWFQIPDSQGWLGRESLIRAFALPWFCGSLSLIVFLSFRRMLGKKGRRNLNRGFAASSLACYYWFRIPALFGFGPIPGDGTLMDFRGSWSPHWVWVCRLCTTAFFFWWMFRDPAVRKPWSLRPTYLRYDETIT
ncbi:MAG: hypothetical protein DWQ01_07560 [Planctomycetota bacterium]|nr:MAG: hypothetical protein DWQ01_07560 [Planctomycetota bacterium]